MQTTKPIDPRYQAWRSRIEGQIKHAMNEHPEWFRYENQEEKKRICRSIGKRIIGEIVAGITTGAKTNIDAVCGAGIGNNGAMENNCGPKEKLWKWTLRLFSFFDKS